MSVLNLPSKTSTFHSVTMSVIVSI